MTHSQLNHVFTWFGSHGSSWIRSSAPAGELLGMGASCGMLSDTGQQVGNFSNGRLTTATVCVFTAGRRSQMKVNLAKLIAPQCIYSFLSTRASWKEIHIQNKSRVSYPCNRPSWLMLSAKLMVYITHKKKKSQMKNSVTKTLIHEGVSMAFSLSKIVI